MSKTSAQLYSRALPWGVWKITLPLFLPILLAGAILPEYVGQYRKVSSAPLTLDHQPVWNEYGLQAAEQGTFALNGKKVTVDAYRMQDSTGALAAWQWKRPQDSHPADAKTQELSKLSAVTIAGESIALGNHLLLFEGYQPTADELANVFRSLPHQETGPLPTLPQHLPDANLIPNSERYVTGPAALSLFIPEVSAATAAFHLGTEAQLGSFRSKSGEQVRLAIFSFPTLDSARERAAALSNIPKSIVKKTGPLVAVVLSPTDLNAAEGLLSLVRYQAVITGQDSSSAPPTKRDNWGNFMVNLFLLIGIVLAFCLLSGAFFGGMRALFRRGGESGDGDSMISLHLDNR